MGLAQDSVRWQDLALKVLNLQSIITGFPNQAKSYEPLTLKVQGTTWKTSIKNRLGELSNRSLTE